MSKVIVSPVERWSGTVTLHYPLTLPQLAAYHAALFRVTEFGKLDRVSSAMFYNAIMPGIYACIEKMELNNWPGITPDMFPTKPRKEALKMAEWLYKEVDALSKEEDEPVPNASTGTPTPKPSDSLMSADGKPEVQS